MLSTWSVVFPASLRRPHPAFFPTAQAEAMVFGVWVCVYGTCIHLCPPPSAFINAVMVCSLLLPLIHCAEPLKSTDQAPGV